MLLSCGEASGDVYLGRLARALRERRPELRLVGVVGPHGREAGVEEWASTDELAVMGFVEIVRHLPRLYRLGTRLARRAAHEGVDLFVPIDYPGFHLRLAARMQARGIPTLDFIPPKTWSWGRHRLAPLRRHVEQCAVIFPFEVEHYGSAGIDVRFVGHPLMDLHAERLATRADGRDGLLLVPGSREQELRRLVPVMAEVVRRLRRSGGPSLRVRVSRAPGVRLEWLRALLDPAVGAELVEGTLVDQLRASSVAIVCSGTATVEAAISDTPHVIVYRTGRLTYALARRLARVEHIGMANIVLGRRAFPEFLQDELEAGAVAAEVGKLFLGQHAPEVAAQREASRELRAALGGRGCFERVADLVVARLDRAARLRSAIDVPGSSESPPSSQ